MKSEEINRSDRMQGVLLGTAAGDSIGLPGEGLSRPRVRRFLGPSPFRHNFFFGRGMISDDTEHACMTAQALLHSQSQPALFASSLAWRLRFWLLGIPAGVGLATLRSILKLWIGFSPGKSGVYSAGNGPAMRSGVIGIYTENIDLLKELVKASTVLTHSDPRAYEGALAVALACRYASARKPDEIGIEELFTLFDEHLSHPEFKTALKIVKESLLGGKTAQETADLFGMQKGVSGYIVNTVAMSLFCWLRHRDSFRAAVEEVILLGGDTDTTGAITGALAGASLGAGAIPAEWLNGIMEYPRSVKWIRLLGRRLAQSRSVPQAGGPMKLFWPALLIRNALFTLIVLLHGFMRLFY
jgi:ADP-ribosyl-[dinitrogen reductase] hydrolase